MLTFKFLPKVKCQKKIHKPDPYHGLDPGSEIFVVPAESGFKPLIILDFRNKKPWKKTSNFGITNDHQIKVSMWEPGR